jgi:serine protease Do
MKLCPLILACTIATSALSLPLFADVNTCSPTQVSKAFTGVSKKAIPAVVFIKVEITAAEADPYNSGQGFPMQPHPFFGDDLFNRFFNSPYGGKPQTPRPVLSQGSGFILTENGFIMTNAHVVKGADKIEVTLNDGQILPAILIGADPQTDIAIIKVEEKNLPYLELADSEKVEVGEWVVAIGNPFQLTSSLTAGVVSATGRQGLHIADYEDFIQTDAAINPGNSGGPLLNLDGTVIGINTAIVGGGNMGIGFAVPSNMAKNVMDQIINNGSVTRGYLGISLQPINKELAEGFNLDKVEGVLVADVVKNSPAEQAGLKSGDIILEYNGKKIKSDQTFRNDVSNMIPGSSVKLKVNRKGETVLVNIVLGAAPSGANADAINQKLGIEVEELNPELSKQLGMPYERQGVVITSIKPGSPVNAAHIRPGSIIVSVNHKSVTNISSYQEHLKESHQTKKVLLLISYNGVNRYHLFKIE